MFRRHPVLAPLTLLYLAAVAWVTLGPQPLDPQQAHWLERVIEVVHRFADGRFPTLAGLVTYSHVEFAANVVMFVPAGVFFLLMFGRRLWWLVILLCFAMTAFIEGVQRYIPGRVPDVRDLESNALGAVIGVLLGLLLTVSSARRERDRRRIRQLEAEVARYRGVGV